MDPTSDNDHFVAVLERRLSPHPIFLKQLKHDYLPQRARSSQSFRIIVHHSLDADLENFDVDVDQQTNLAALQLQIRQKLRFVNGCQLVN